MGCVRWRRRRFCGDKPLHPGQWEAERRRLSVLVLESQSLLNLLTSGRASLADVDLLVRPAPISLARVHARVEARAAPHAPGPPPLPAVGACFGCGAARVWGGVHTAV